MTHGLTTNITLAIILLLTGCASTGETVARADLNNRQQATMANVAKKTDAPSAPDGRLESLLAYAMDHNPELAAQFERWRAAVHRISKARRLPDPVISYAYYINSVETRVGPQRHRVSLKQTFPWPSRLSSGADAAAAQAGSEQAKFDAMALAIAATVEQIYWRIWKIQQSRKIHQLHATVLVALSESANAMLMTGRIDLSQQQQIDLASARVADTISSLEEQLAGQLATLRGIINAPTDMKIQVTATPNLQNRPLDEAALLESVKNHPSLLAYDAMAQSSALNAKKETSYRYPNFTLGVDWIATAEARAPNTPDSGKDALIAGVGLSIPLWQANYQDGIAAYHAEQRAYLLDRTAATNRAVANYYLALANLRDAQRRMTLYQETLVPQAQAVYQSVLGAYASGRSDVAATLLAQENLLELRLQLIAAQADYLSSMTLVKQLAGREPHSQTRLTTEGDQP